MLFIIFYYVKFSFKFSFKCSFNYKFGKQKIKIVLKLFQSFKLDILDLLFKLQLFKLFCRLQLKLFRLLKLFEIQGGKLLISYHKRFSLS